MPGVTAPRMHKKKTRSGSMYFKNLTKSVTWQSQNVMLICCCVDNQEWLILRRAYSTKLDGSQPSTRSESYCVWATTKCDQPLSWSKRSLLRVSEKWIKRRIHYEGWFRTTRRCLQSYHEEECWDVGGHIDRGSLYVTHHIEANYELSTQPCKFSHGIERSISRRFVSNTSSCATSFRPTKPATDYLTSRVYCRPW